MINAIEKMNSGPEIKSELKYKSKSSAHTISDFKKLSSLKPPPNLLDCDIMENKSDIIQSKNQEENFNQPNKAQTPQIMMKKGANNFFNHRPSTGRKKIMTNVPEN